MVPPIIEFSAHLWAFKVHSKFNQIQYNALRFFFGLGKASPIAALIGDSGCVPLHSLVPRLLPSFLSHTVQKTGREPGRFDHVFILAPFGSACHHVIYVTYSFE